MAVGKGSDIGVQICEALGLDPERTAGISITIEPCSVAVVSVKMYIHDDHAQALVEVLKKHELAEKSE